MLIEIGKTEKNQDITYRFWFRPIFHCLYFFILYLYSLGWANVPYEANFVFVKLALFEFSKKAMFSWFFENLLNDIDVGLA